MSKKSRRIRNKQRNKQMQAISQSANEHSNANVNGHPNTNLHANNVHNTVNITEAPPVTKRVRDLPKYGQYALSICLFLNFITKAKADNLHSDWNGVLFQTNDANAINFGLQLDPDTYPDVAGVTAQILHQCGNLVQVVAPTWWNDVSIDWQSLYTSCQTGIYKTQAQAYMALSQYVLDQIEDISIPNTVWQCFDQVLEPSCQTSFFTDWAGLYKALAILGLAVGACATLCVGYGVHQYLKGIWSQRSGYDQIRDRQPAPSFAPAPKDIEANPPAAQEEMRQASSMSVDI